ncbi:TIGR03013 family PEP-CTERM/XrtA system glycosyltransferase [Oxalobacteraceae bacterium]|nr:TIGR03013 family PEP-CTERM/XrtA system glycosyltransferase [Oxalobacteraceae bacterium]
MIRIFHHYVSRMAFLLLLLEMLVLLAAAAGASLFWLADAKPGGNLALTACVFASVLLFSMSTLGMYQHSRREDLTHSFIRIMPAFGLGFALFSALVYLIPSLQPGRSGSLGFVLGCAGVLLMRLLVFTSARSRMLAERLILVGDGAIARECIELASQRPGLHRFQVVGCLSVEGEARQVPSAVVLPAGQSLLQLARQHGAREIVVTVSDRRNGAFPVRQLLECALGGVAVSDAATFFEREACQIRIDSLQPSFLIFGGGFDQSLLRAAVKRGFDLLASAAIGLAALPVMLLAAAWIRCEDGGPVFYHQERVGKNGHVFHVLKFRSMRQDAESDGKPIWAAANDARVTRIGHWLRKLRIDELPQMFNVFKGDMSFVGPRPERAYFVERLCADVPYYNVRHTIKPGITGLAQVRYQYGASVDDAVRKLQYDLYYVKNNSLFLDLLILLDTVQVVLLGKGSR